MSFVVSVSFTLYAVVVFVAEMLESVFGAELTVIVIEVVAVTPSSVYETPIEYVPAVVISTLDVLIVAAAVTSAVVLSE
jgi:hypothetical protein